MHRLTLLTLLAATAFAADDYKPGPDSLPQEGVPKGELIKGTFDKSEIFPGTTREYTIYLPQQLDRKAKAPYMVFQDGVIYQAPVVFDNLIAKKEIPAMIGFFIKPGVVPAPHAEAMDRFNRSLEYDATGDAYAKFLMKDIIPFMEKTHGLKLSRDPNDHAIAGSSSGGVCAFTAAWERPDHFRRVFTSVGTYIGLRGADEYPILVRKTEPKPIRIFLQDGSNDNNIYCGDWWIANQAMERSLTWAGYDVNHAWGEGGHNQKHATQVFPDAMRWLWRDYPEPIKADPRGESKVKTQKDILAPGAQWELVSEGHGFTEGPACNAAGEVFFTDIPNNKIHKVGLDGKVSVFAEDTHGANGLMFGPDGRLFACANGAKQIVAYTPDGKTSVIAEGIESNDIAITHNGLMYVTDPGHRQVWLVKPSGEKQVVDTGIQFPNGVLLSPDQSLLYVADMDGQFIWSFQVQADGSLRHKQRYFYLHQNADNSSRADGMTVDTNGFVYVATAKGLQVCDQPGRVNAILPAPQYRSLSNVCFGGPGLDELYVTNSDKVFKRKTKVKGLLSGLNAPIKPPKPGL